ncbi:outer membrane protein assembly factor [Spirosoma sp. KNUC1025]|nr:outer membrane protein assembly factor [Spirosoma sp. KNUC1025]
MGEHVQLSVGPLFQYFKLDIAENRGRFIEGYLNKLPEQERFLRQEGYGGFQAAALIDTRNDAVQPARGIYWNTTLLGLQGFGEQVNHLTQLRTDLTTYISFSRAARFVLVNRVGGGLTYGNPAFYQLLYLGGQDNLRGFRTYRFAGDHMVYHNLEARLKLFDFRSYLFPGSVGFMAFNDLGRVWSRGERSTKWHDGYGAGLYVTPASLLVLTASVGFSEEGTLPYVSMGYRF